MFCENDVPDRAVRKWTVIQGGLLAELSTKWWRVGEGWAGLQLHPDGLVVVDLEKCHPQIHHRVAESQITQAARIPVVEVEQHILVSGAGRRAYAPKAP